VPLWNTCLLVFSSRDRQPYIHTNPSLASLHFTSIYVLLVLSKNWMTSGKSRMEGTQRWELMRDECTVLWYRLISCTCAATWANTTINNSSWPDRCLGTIWLGALRILHTAALKSDRCFSVFNNAVCISSVDSSLTDSRSAIASFSLATQRA
jgi:hypothetical protein